MGGLNLEKEEPCRQCKLKERERGSDWRNDFIEEGHDNRSG